MGDQTEPEVVRQARATLKTNPPSWLTRPLMLAGVWWIGGFTGYAAYGAYTLLADGNWVHLPYAIAGLMGVGLVALVTLYGWSKLPKVRKALNILSMFEQSKKRARTEQLQQAVHRGVTRTNDPEQRALELDTNHPLKAIALRIRELTADSPQVTKTIDELITHLVQAEKDIGMLRRATEAERALADSESTNHVARLAGAMKQKEAFVDQLSTALRNLHVEMTAQHSNDHSALVQEISDLIARIAAETEVNEVVATAATQTTKQSSQAPKSLRTRHPQRERQ